MHAASPSAQRTAWQALARHAEAAGGLSLRGLFAQEPDRGERMTLEAAELRIDTSKQLASRETLRLLLALAEASQLSQRTAELLAGARVNTTEQRPALHVALRAPRGTRIRVDGEDVVPGVHEVLSRMQAFCERVRSGAHRGHTDRPIRSVVNLGIGGSHLGPELVTRALSAYAHDGPEVRFVSNVDGAAFADATRDLDPASTLFVVCSKTFTTLETLVNARSARAWCLAALRDESAVARHFVAVSTNAAEVAKFGIAPENTFGFWDWVGGRFSVASAVGLSAMLAIGPGNFRALLAGMRLVDEHFASAPPERNAPVMLGLLDVWYACFLGAQTRAVIPYSERLARLPAYLQQLEMESNGKRVDRDGHPVDHATSPIVWGEPGTNGQHAFFQLLHQGTRLVPCDLIGFAAGEPGLQEHQDWLVANLLAQAEALAFGRSAEEVRAAGIPETLVPHRTFPGNRPSTLMLAAALTPSVLGQLIALHEHRVFVQGVLYGVNSFDQWGVELGKSLASRIHPELGAAGSAELSHDASTNALIRWYRARRG